MSMTIDYYFSTSSPWTYLGSGRFIEIARSVGATVKVRPVNYGVIFPQSGGLPLPKRSPQRQAYRMMELKRWRDYLGIQEPVKKPANEHPKRPVQGFDCPRNEVSGTRVYEFARDGFGSPAEFFARFFLVNYCPLSFMEAGGKNRTPDKLPAAEREPLFAACDASLLRVVTLLKPRMVIGIGAFAEACARRVLGPQQVRLGLQFGRMLHPSPASPIANRGWAAAAQKDLETCLAQLD